LTSHFTYALIESDRILEIREKKLDIHIYIILLEIQYKIHPRLVPSYLYLHCLPSVRTRLLLWIYFTRDSVYKSDVVYGTQSACFHAIALVAGSPGFDSPHPNVPTIVWIFLGGASLYLRTSSQPLAFVFSHRQKSFLFLG
jgi:hypothetical protein